MHHQSILKRLALLSLSGFLLSACSTNEDSEVVDEDTEQVETVPEDSETQSEDDQETTLSQNMADWVPIIENKRYVYEGEGNESAAFTLYPQFTHNDTLQVVQSSSGTDVVKVYEYSENEVREVFQRGETYFRDDIVDTGLTTEQEQLEILLQSPIEVGHSWESPSGSVSEITDTQAAIETPAGTFEAVEVTKTINDTTTLMYYAPKVGLVQSIYEPDSDRTVTSTLSEIQEDVAEEISFTVYELNEMATALTTTEATLELNTNDPARLQLAEVLRGNTDDGLTVPPLTENVEINYLYLSNDGIVHVDFSEELVSEMNAGSGIEAMLLQGLVNTIGGLYQADEIMLTVDEAPYSSGHIALEEGQTMKVDRSSVEE